MTTRRVRSLWNGVKKAVKNHKYMWILILTIFPLIGLCIDFFSFREGIDFGDGSTFYQFAHDLAHGEIIYKDFIHFRTPGSYFLYALFLKLFGDSLGTIRFALAFESQFLYPLIFLVAVGLMLKFRKPLLGFLTGGLIIFLPAFAQLRSAFAFLAVALYVQAYRDESRQRMWRILAGVAVGVCFTFGQDSAAIAVAVIGLSEIIINARVVVAKELLRRIGWLILGSLIGALPLLLYVLVLSNFGTFLYYVFYYAFILQPKSMNLPYPDFEYINLIFYVSFALYLLAFFVLYAAKKKRWPFIIFLVFAVGRYITPLGRADMGHLIFALPEVLFLGVITIAGIRDAVFTKQIFLRFIPWGIGLGISFYLAVHFGSPFIVLAMIVLLAAFRMRKDKVKGRDSLDGKLATTAVACAVFAILLYQIYPLYKSVYSAMSRQPVGATQIEGVKTDEADYQEYKQLQAAVKPYHPTTIFSYPIQPFYYKLAAHHATRFITFEFETTKTEQAEAISDLRRTKPQVVIYDPQQVKDLHASISQLDDYVLQHYRIVKIVDASRPLWVMVPSNE